jgi:hypothetical protein
MAIHLFRRGSCPVTPSSGRGFRAADLVPLLGFVLPTVAIGYGVVIPRSCIAGINALTLGFASSIAGACIAYVVGVRRALQR